MGRVCGAVATPDLLPLALHLTLSTSTSTSTHLYRLAQLFRLCFVCAEHAMSLSRGGASDLGDPDPGVAQRIEKSLLVLSSPWLLELLQLQRAERALLTAVTLGRPQLLTGCRLRSSCSYPYFLGEQSHTCRFGGPGSMLPVRNTVRLCSVGCYRQPFIARHGMITQG
jgi:hypothetical protein